jgi:hypothetical protein
VYAEIEVESPNVHDIFDLIAGIKETAKRPWFTELGLEEPHISRWADLCDVTNYKVSKGDIIRILGALRRIYQEESGLQTVVVGNLGSFADDRKDG